MSDFAGLSEAFFDVVTKYHNQIAITAQGRDYTYSALSDRAKQLSVYMKDTGVYCGDVVAIASDKSFDNYAMMVACLISGVAYVNINTDDTPQRISSMLEQCGALMVFFSESPLEVEAPQVCFHDVKADGERFSTSNIDGECVAYMMFTSGSTGQPKGVMISHDNLREFISWAGNRYKIDYKDSFAQLSPLYFDNSVFDFYTSIFYGARLVAVPKNLLSNPKALVDFVDEQRCTIWFSVPSLFIYLTVMKAFRPDVLNSVRVFTFGGEGFPKSELKKVYDIYGEQADFVNVYGPTECTCICSSYEITDKDFLDLDGIPSIGSLNDAFDYLIVDGETEADEGELYLVGPCVGKGYVSNKALTESRFGILVGDDLVERAYYKTGDLVKSVDGKLFFLGRADNQIKHMGYRIELEEIEFSLNGIPGVSRAVVLYHRNNAMFGNIVAFIVGDDSTLDLDSVREDLSSKIPSYMLPSKYVLLESFDRNPNGKVDKASLTAML